MPTHSCLPFPTVKSLTPSTKTNATKCSKRQPDMKIDEDVSPNKMKSPSTPSTMFSRMSIIQDENKKPRKLFEYSSKLDVIHNALHSGIPEVLIGREDQMKFLNDFFDQYLETRQSSSLYISGPPGSGKTASLNILLSTQRIMSNFRCVYLNCTSLRTSNAIYKRIIEQLHIKIRPNVRLERKLIELITKEITSTVKPVLLILDEIDELGSKSQSVLYTLFEWPVLPKSRLVLIGIANALDLVDRLLPRLQSCLTIKPTLLHFPSYNKKQIADIISQRLQQANVEKTLFPEPAVQLLAAKVAAVSGDARRALDIARTVLDDSHSNSFNDASSIKNVEMRHVLKVVNTVYGTSQSFNNFDDHSDVTNNDGTKRGGDHLPLQQKLTVASILVLLKNEKCDKSQLTISKESSSSLTVWNKRRNPEEINKFISLIGTFSETSSLNADSRHISLILSTDVLLNKLYELTKIYETYKNICKRRNISFLDMGEFISTCSLIETRGIFCIKSKNKNRLSKVLLMWDDKDMTTALSDKTLLADILNNEDC